MQGEQKETMTRRVCVEAMRRVRGEHFSVNVRNGTIVIHVKLPASDKVNTIHESVMLVESSVNK